MREKPPIFQIARYPTPPPEAAFPHGEGGSAKPRRMRGDPALTKNRVDEWALPGRSLSQPGADSSLYAREPLYRPRSEMFIGARLFSVVGGPSSVRAYALPPSPWGKATSGGGLGYRALRDDERVFLPHPSGLRPVHLPRRGRHPPGGGGLPPPGNSITVRCRRRTGPACRGLRGRRRRARGGR